MRLGEAQALLSCTETSTNLTYVSIIGNSVGGEGGVGVGRRRLARAVEVGVLGGLGAALGRDRDHGLGHAWG